MVTLTSAAAAGAGDPAYDVDDVGAQQRLAAGEAYTVDAEARRDVERPAISSSVESSSGPGSQSAKSLGMQ